MTIPVVASSKGGTTRGSFNTIHTSTAEAVSSEYNNVEFCATVSPLTLTDGEEATLVEGEQYTGVVYTRTLDSRKFGTIVLPFAPDAKSLESYAFYELSSGDETTLTFSKVESPEACKPYLYKLTAEGVPGAAITASDVAISTTVVPTIVGGWIMTGTLNNETIDCATADKYFYGYNSANCEINRVTNTLTVGQFRAYFTTEASSSAKQMRIVVSDETTGMYEIHDFGTVNSDGTVYDLQGRKVAEPTKGLYIINGRKVNLRCPLP